MPLAEWYLKPWGHHTLALDEQDRITIRVQIDPTTISGQRGAFGPALFLKYTLSGINRDMTGPQLLSLEGWIGWTNETEYAARLRIPSQTLWPNIDSLQVPVTDEQIEAIERHRNSGVVSLTVALAGLATFPMRLPAPPASSPGRPGTSGRASPIWQGTVQVQNANVNQVVIERERWLTILQQLEVGTRRLVELPEPRLPRQEPRWAECLRLLEGATQFYRRGEYDQALINCRQIAEGIPQVLCDVWDLPQQRRGQVFADWMQAIEQRLIAAWPDDPLTPGMLRTLLTGAWRWLAPAPHYGTGIPLREEAAFALGLCTDLLHFAGQSLQAHPTPIAGVP